MWSRHRQIAILLMLLIVCVIGVRGGDENQKLKVIATIANIREAPSIDSKVISQSAIGAVLESDSRQGDWFRVALPQLADVKSRYGFVHYSVIQVLAESVALKTIPEKLSEKKVPIEEKPVSEVAKEVSEEGAWILSEANRRKAESSEGAGARGGEGNDAWILSKKSPESRKAKSISLEISEFGARVGLNSAYLSSGILWNSGEMTSRIGFSFGGFLHIKLGKWLGLEPEVLFTSKGGKVVSLYGSTKSTMTYRYNYFELPLRMKATIPIGTAIAAFVAAGPFVSMKLSSGGTSIMTYSTGQESISDIAADIPFFDLGGIAGAGVCLNLGGRKRVSLEVRYELGLINTALGSKTRNYAILFGFSI